MGPTISARDRRQCTGPIAETVEAQHAVRMTQVTDHIVSSRYRVPLEAVDELLSAHRAWHDAGYETVTFRGRAARA